MKKLLSNLFTLYFAVFIIGTGTSLLEINNFKSDYNQEIEEAELEKSEKSESEKAEETKELEEKYHKSSEFRLSKFKIDIQKQDIYFHNISDKYNSHILSIISPPPEA